MHTYPHSQCLGFFNFFSQKMVPVSKPYLVFSYVRMLAIYNIFFHLSCVTCIITGHFFYLRQTRRGTIPFCRLVTFAIHYITFLQSHQLINIFERTGCSNNASKWCYSNRFNDANASGKRHRRGHPTRACGSATQQHLGDCL